MYILSYLFFLLLTIFVWIILFLGVDLLLSLILFLLWNCFAPSMFGFPSVGYLTMLAFVIFIEIVCGIIKHWLN